MDKIIIKDLNETIYKDKLDNGMEVYVYPSDIADNYVINLCVKYGSIDTSFKVDNKVYNVSNGIAHFLEHIKFNEESGDANKYFYEHGAYSNAYTTFDRTVYIIEGLKDLKDNLEHLLYFVLTPYFNEEIINKEKPIICEEARNTISNPDAYGEVLLLNNILHKDNHKYLVTGTPEDINNISLDEINAVFNNFYVPSNMIITITGSVDVNEIKDILNNYFKGKIYNDYKAIKLYENEDSSIKKEYEEIHNTVEETKFIMGYKVDLKKFDKLDYLSKRLYIKRILNLNFGGTSDFYNEVVVNKHYTNYLSCDYLFIKDYIIVLLFGSSKKYKKIISIIEDKFKNLNVSKEEFERSKKVTIASTILRFEKHEYIGDDILYDVFEVGKYISNIKELYEQMNYDNLKYVEDILKDTKNSVIVIKP